MGGGVVEVGFPSVWGVVQGGGWGRARGGAGVGEGYECACGSAGGGRVVNLSGVRAVGVGAE